MPRNFIAAVVWLLMAACAFRSASGDGLIQTLPLSKSWVRYRMSEEWANGTAREIDISIRLVRRELYKNIPCSFVEILLSVPDDTSIKRSYLFLMLDGQKIDHTFLTNPTSVWSKKSDGVYARKNDPWDGFLPRLKLIFLPTAERMSTSLNKTIRVDAVELDCTVHSGASSYKSDTEHVQVTYEIAESAKVPFGVAELTLSVDQRLLGDAESTTGTIKFHLTEFGANEFSKSPN